MHNLNTMRRTTRQHPRTKVDHRHDALQYVRVPVLNDDMHRVGWELVRFGPGFTAAVRSLATEGRL